MSNGSIGRNLVPGITLKIGFPLLLGLSTLVSAQAGGMSGGNSLVLAAIVTSGSALILFIVDTEARISAVGKRMADGSAEIGRSAELAAMMERSVLGTGLLMDFLEAASRTGERVNPLLLRLARREMKRLTSFVRLLEVGSEIVYDGEDRDWLLGLTREAERSIDAIALSTVAPGTRGFDSGLFDGGLWTSDLGVRYLELQREAIARHVRIRRIFVVENADLAHDEAFMRITQMQREVGVQVRMLDRKLIPDWMQSMIFDFVVFDGTIGYEMTSGTTYAATLTSMAVLRTSLAPMPERVQHLEGRFGLLWEAANPERDVDE